MSERREFVLSAPVGRAIGSLAWPISLSNQLAIVTVTVMLFWLGRFTGDDGLAVESLFRPFGLLVAWLFGATSVGAGVLVSRSVGAADRQGLSAAAAGLTLTFGMCIVFIAIAVPAIGPLAQLLAGGVPIVTDMEHWTLAWVLVTLPGLALAEVLLEVASSTGETRFMLVRVILDLAFMAALAPLLMDVLGIGIAGAPLAEGLGALGLLGVMWVALVRGRERLGLGELGPGAWRIRWDVWKQVLGIGMPVQAGRVAMFVGQLILVQRVARDGEASVAGYGVAGALLLFGTMATLGLAQATAIVIGQSLGAGLRDRARDSVRAGLVGGWLVMAAFIIATLAARPVIAQFTSDPAIARAAEHALSLLRWSAPAIATWQILLACFAAHRATLRAGVLVVGGEAVGVAIAFAWPGNYLDAVCAAFVIANVLKAALLLGLVATGTLAQARLAR